MAKMDEKVFFFSKKLILAQVAHPNPTGPTSRPGLGPGPRPGLGPGPPWRGQAIDMVSRWLFLLIGDSHWDRGIAKEIHSKLFLTM